MVCDDLASRVRAYRVSQQGIGKKNGFFSSSSKQRALKDLERRSVAAKAMVVNHGGTARRHRFVEAQKRVEFISESNAGLRTDLRTPPTYPLNHRRDYERKIRESRGRPATSVFLNLNGGRGRMGDNDLDGSSGDDKILYALIARGQTSLVDYSVREGNHVLLAQQILGKAKQDTDHKRSFPDKSGRYQFHYMLKDGITYLCFATSDKKTSVCFSFLDEIRLRFRGTYEEDLIAKAMAYSTSFLDFKRILKEEMIRFGNIEFADNKTAEVSRKIDGVRNTMKNNIDKLWERDSEIEDLLEKTELLDIESSSLKVSSGKLKNKIWWKNVKVWVIIIVISIIAIWLIASLACGFKFQCLKKCFHEKSLISIRGKEYSFLELQSSSSESGCVVPHVVQAKGVAIFTDCKMKRNPLIVTSDHLVATENGWQEAGTLSLGSVIFGSLDYSQSCRVIAVKVQVVSERYFGLNCPHSTVLANGFVTSTFARLHQIPAFWMRHMSAWVGIHRASAWGDSLANVYYLFARS